jgi:hypothetical protein
MNDIEHGVDMVMYMGVYTYVPIPPRFIAG